MNLNPLGSVYAFSVRMVPSSFLEKIATSSIKGRIFSKGSAVCCMVATKQICVGLIVVAVVALIAKQFFSNPKDKHIDNALEDCKGNDPNNTPAPLLPPVNNNNNTAPLAAQPVKPLVVNDVDHLPPSGAAQGSDKIPANSYALVDPSLNQKDNAPVKPFSQTVPSGTISTVPEIEPNWVENVPDNGNCLLLAALKHIWGRILDEELAEQIAYRLRVAMAKQVLEITDSDDKTAIVSDILEVREMALKKLNTEGSDIRILQPFCHLFTQQMDTLFPEGAFPLELSDTDFSIVKQAYSTYILVDKPKAYLGQYALRYLDSIYKRPTEANEVGAPFADGGSKPSKFIVVRKGVDKGTYIVVRGDIDVSLVDAEQRRVRCDNIGVLLFEPAKIHYKYVNGTHLGFQQALFRGLQKNTKR